MPIAVPKYVLDCIRALKTVQPEDMPGGGARDRLAYINGAVDVLLERHLREADAPRVSPELLPEAISGILDMYFSLPTSAEIGMPFAIALP